MKNTALSHPFINLCIYFTLVLPVIACNSSQNKRNDQKTDTSKTNPQSKNIKKPASSYTDTLIITSPSAVFYNPDSLQLEKIKAVNETMVYQSLEHNCFYQMRNSRIVLKKYWPQIHIIETSKARYLQFVHQDKKSTVIDLDGKNDICGIFLFDPQKEPLLIDMMNVDTELGFYFKKP